MHSNIVLQILGGSIANYMIGIYRQKCYVCTEISLLISHCTNTTKKFDLFV